MNIFSKTNLHTVGRFRNWSTGRSVSVMESSHFRDLFFGLSMRRTCVWCLSRDDYWISASFYSRSWVSNINESE